MAKKRVWPFVNIDNVKIKSLLYVACKCNTSLHLLLYSVFIELWNYDVCDRSLMNKLAVKRPQNKSRYKLGGNVWVKRGERGSVSRPQLWGGRVGDMCYLLYRTLHLKLNVTSFEFTYIYIHIGPMLKVWHLEEFCSFVKSMTVWHGGKVLGRVWETKVLHGGEVLGNVWHVLKVKCDMEEKCWDFCWKCWDMC